MSAIASAIPAVTLRVDAVLFDLDGTLIDSAPDLATAVNAMRAARAMEPLPYLRLRPMVGSGARGMIGAAFGVVPGEPGFERLRDEFLERYAEGLLASTQVFERMLPVVARIEQAGLPWGWSAATRRRTPSPIRRHCSRRRAASASHRRAAYTWETICATSWRVAMRAWRRWRRPGATWGKPSPSTPGAPTRCSKTLPTS
jgi:hypothetical protein